VWKGWVGEIPRSSTVVPRRARVEGAIVNARRLVVFGALAVLLTGQPLPPVHAADTPIEMLAASVTPPGGSTDTGFLTLRLTVELTYTDPEGLPETINLDAVARRTTTGLADYWRLPHIVWRALTQVSGTPNHGVWSSSTVVTRAYAGSYRFAGLTDLSPGPGPDMDVPAPDGPTITITASDVWDVRTTTAPVKVVTGHEPWTPTALVTSRSSGTPVAAWTSTIYLMSDEGWVVRVGSSTEPGNRLAANGVYREWPLPADFQEDPAALQFWARRGSRGWSLEAMGHPLCAAVKIQANSRYSRLSVSHAAMLTVSGNAFPAPAIHELFPPGEMLVHLQRLTLDEWHTVATSYVRSNGRYDVTWSPDRVGIQQMRIRVPGKVEGCAAHVGTNLASVAVTVTQ
jgi:hypothetical protein